MTQTAHLTSSQQSVLNNPMMHDYKVLSHHVPQLQRNDKYMRDREREEQIV